MRRPFLLRTTIRACLGATLLGLLAPLWAQDAAPDIFQTLQEAERLKQQGHYLEARVAFDEALYFLQVRQRLNPKEEAGLVATRLADCRGEIARLKSPATEQALTPEARAATGPLYEEGVRLETARRDRPALRRFELCLMTLDLIRRSDPDWKRALVGQKITEAQRKVYEVRDRLVPTR